MRYRKDFALYERGGVYYARYWDQRTGKRRAVSTGRTSKGEAHAEAKRLLGQGDGRAVRLDDYAKGFFKWGECKWIKRQHAKGRPFSSTQARVRRAQLDSYILPEFGQRVLAEITRPAIERWLLKLDLANQTKNHMLYTFRIVLREAAADGLIAVSPLATTEPFARNPRHRDILTLQELRKLFPARRSDLLKVWGGLEYSALFMVLASTGIRSGEARALAWECVLPGGWLVVNRAWKADGTLGTTKTNDERVVPLPANTQKVLRWWRKESEFTTPADLVFHGLDGGRTPLESSTLVRAFPRALRQAEIAVGDRNLTTHSLRHGFNTLYRPLLPEGALHSLTGHKTSEMSSYYDHPDIRARMEKIQPFRQLIEEAWAGKKSKKDSKVAKKIPLTGQVAATS